MEVTLNAKKLNNMNLKHSLPHKFGLKMIEKARNTEYQSIPLGVIGVISFIIYYFVWNKLTPNEYHNLYLRIVGALLCFFLMLKNYWPQKLKKILPVYWYITLLYCFPFFFTFMMFKNPASNVWLLTTMTGVFYLMLLVDWFDLLVIIILGTGLSWICYIITTDKIVIPTLLLQTLPAYCTVFIAGKIFLYRTSVIQKEKIVWKTELERMKSVAIFSQIATQVAHDIRSPLLVLTHVLNDLSSFPEKKRIDLRNAIQRVTDIANSLLFQYKQENNQADLVVTHTQEPVALMLESLASEKRIPLANSDIQIALEIRPNAYDAFVLVDIVGFKRVLSNLINNAIEAVKNKEGIIDIILSKRCGKIIIEIRDNGCGISNDKLLAILKEKASVGKKEGFGLGLSYALNKISEWQGDYSLTSEPDKGTQFEIILPESSPAAWFRTEIIIHEGTVVAVLDDDDYIHEVWRDQFPQSSRQANRLTLYHFKNVEDFVNFCINHKFANITFFLDYELKDCKETGLDLAEMLNIGMRSTLVTSRYEDLELRKKCQVLNMKIIPKLFARLVPIHVFSPTDMVFIDDNKPLTEYWKASAESAGKSINVFHHPHDFMCAVNRYNPDTLIYMDSSLGSLKGEDFAKILYDQGYQNIILATGYPKEHFKHVTWVKEIVGKEPPWG